MAVNQSPGTLPQTAVQELATPQLAPELRKILLHPFVFQRPETDDEINDNSFDPAARAGFKFHMSVFPAFHLGYPNINAEST